MAVYFYCFRRLFIYKNAQYIVLRMQFKTAISILFSIFVSGCNIIDSGETKVKIINTPINTSPQLSKNVLTLAKAKITNKNKTKIDFPQATTGKDKNSKHRPSGVVGAKYGKSIRLLDFAIPNLNEKPELGFNSTAKSLVYINPIFWGLSPQKRSELWQSIDRDRDFTKLATLVSTSATLLEDDLVKLSSQIALRIAEDKNLATKRPNSDSSSNLASNPFHRVSFPQASCGDSLPTDKNAYPINFYPVYIKANDSNLQKVKSQFCRDAYTKKRKDTGQKAIQVGSFISEEKAKDFKDFMLQKFGSGEIGQPTVRQYRARSPNSLNKLISWFDLPANAQTINKYKYVLSRQFSNQIPLQFSPVAQNIQLTAQNNRITVSGTIPKVAQQIIVVPKNKYKSTFNYHDYQQHGVKNTDIIAERLILPTDPQSLNSTLSPTTGKFQPGEYTVLMSEGYRINRNKTNGFSAFDYNLILLASNVFDVVSNQKISTEVLSNIVTNVSNSSQLANNCHNQLQEEKVNSSNKVAATLTSCIFDSEDTSKIINVFGKSIIGEEFEATEQEALIKFIGQFSAKSIQAMNLDAVTAGKEGLAIAQYLARDIINGVHIAEFSVEDLYAPKNYAIDCTKTPAGQFHDLAMDCYGGLFDLKVRAKNYSNSWYEIERSFKPKPGYDKFSRNVKTSFIRSNLIAPGQEESLLFNRPSGLQNRSLARLRNSKSNYWQTIKVDKIPIKITHFYGKPTKKVTISCNDPQRVVWSINIIPKCTSEGIYIDLNARVMHYTKVTLPSGNIIEFNRSMGGMRHYITSNRQKIDLIFSVE